MTIVLDQAGKQDMITSAGSRESTMATIQQDIESFHRFASEFVRRGESKVTIDDLYEQWRTDRFGDDD